MPIYFELVYRCIRWLNKRMGDMQHSHSKSVGYTSALLCLKVVVTLDICFLVLLFY